MPARSFPEVKDLPNWNNVVPRIGVLLRPDRAGQDGGEGQFRRLRAVAGHRLRHDLQPELFAVDQRTWTDLNRDDIAQENEIGPTSNRNFGVRRNQNPDPDISRPYQLLGDVALQHELFGGFGLSVSYTTGGCSTTSGRDNLAVDPVADYTLVQVPDPRGNGQTLPVYNLAPGKFGLVDELRHELVQQRAWYRGVDVTVNGRWRAFTFLGGTSTGRTLSITCDVADPEQPAVLRSVASRRAAPDAVQAVGQLTCRTAFGWARTSRACLAPSASSPTRSSGRSCRR